MQRVDDKVSDSDINTANSLVLIGDVPSAQISSWSGCRSESNISHANLVVRI
jgi:hypothetical protein